MENGELVNDELLLISSLLTYSTEGINKLQDFEKRTQ